MQLVVIMMAFVAITILLALIVARRRLETLNAASWLVILGAVILMTEHPVFAIAYSVALPSVADDLQRAPMPLLPHARTHFFMAGIYTLIGVVLLIIITRTLLLEGRRSGWFAILFAVLVGGFSELIIGAQWFQHGLPLYNLFGIQPVGFGWQFLYIYLVAWIAALVISYRPIFLKEPAQGIKTNT